MTNRDKVIAALRHAAYPIDDDELARRTGITPRQTVNQICRRLETEGRMSRLSGADGKIVNKLRRHAAVIDATVAEPSPVAHEAHAVAAGSSTEQQIAERNMLDALGQRLGMRLDPRSINRDDGVRVEIDGADDAQWSSSSVGLTRALRRWLRSTSW